MASTEAQAAAKAYAKGVLDLDMSSLKTVLSQMYDSSYAAGMLTAIQQTGVATGLGSGLPTSEAGWTSFWDNWKPGNQSAADLLSGNTSTSNLHGLHDLMAQQDVAIAGISNTTYDKLGARLADGVARGDSVDTISNSLMGVLNDPVRAFMIADTETARAVSAASMDGYAAAGIEKVEWLVSPGACKICLDYSEGSPFLRLDAPIQPAHPYCRCSYSPVDPGTGQATGGDLGMTEDAVDQAANAAQQAANPGYNQDGTINSVDPYWSASPHDQIAADNAYHAGQGFSVSDALVAGPGYAATDTNVAIMDRLFSDWAGKLSRNETEALRSYQGAGYDDINNFLRGKSSALGGRDRITSIDSAIARGKAPQDMTTYRGMNSRHLDNLKVGGYITDNGFTSTSLSREAASAFSRGVVITVQVPEGTPMAWIQLATKTDMGEAEVLLGRGGRYYYDGVKNGQKTFHYVAQKVAK